MNQCFLNALASNFRKHENRNIIVKTYLDFLYSFYFQKTHLQYCYFHDPIIYNDSREIILNVLYLIKQKIIKFYSFPIQDEYLQFMSILQHVLPLNVRNNEYNPSRSFKKKKFDILSEIRNEIILPKVDRYDKYYLQIENEEHILFMFYSLLFLNYPNISVELGELVPVIINSDKQGNDCLEVKGKTIKQIIEEGKENENERINRYIQNKEDNRKGVLRKCMGRREF